MGLVSVRRGRHALVLGTMGGALLLCLLVAAAVGTVYISLPDVLKMALNRLPVIHLAPTWRAVEETVIFQIRLPRVVGAALVGAALASAGVLFQGLLRNPLADPYVIGTSAGAGLGAIIAMMLPINFALLGFGLLPGFAFLGAMATVMLVYNLARVGARTPVVSMLLAGFAVSAMLAAVMSFLMTMSGALQPRIFSAFRFLMGGVMVNDWGQIAVAAPLIVGGIGAARLLAVNLNAFTLGEEGAAYLGVTVERDKRLLLALGSLLTATAVSLSGLVGFVGLVVPHAVRLVLGPDHRLLLPASALTGASFLVLADLLARTLLAPAEIPVGVITALIGSPFFIFLIRRSRREYAL